MIGTILDVNDRELARSQARESEGRFPSWPTAPRC